MDSAGTAGPERRARTPTRLRRVATERFSYAQAAKALGISTDAVRVRVRRGTLRSERDGGRVFVILNADQVRPDNDDTNLTDQLRSEVLYLRGLCTKSRGWVLYMVVQD